MWTITGSRAFAVIMQFHRTGDAVFQSFCLSRRWLPWAYPGAVLILFATWYKVELDVKINGSYAVIC